MSAFLDQPQPDFVWPEHRRAWRRLDHDRLAATGSGPRRHLGRAEWPAALIAIGAGLDVGAILWMIIVLIR